MKNEPNSAPDPRLQRLDADPKLSEERRTLRVMTEDYCRAFHGTNGELCPACAAFLAYAEKRLACCPYGSAKPVCAKCRIHCYRKNEKETARQIMRWAGPRLVFRHPGLALSHLIQSLTVKAPEKPRNRRAAKEEGSK